jgi:hypothetical protein
MTFDWGSVLLTWTTIVFSLGLIVFVGCVVAFTVETRRLRIAAADLPPTGQPDGPGRGRTGGPALDEVGRPGATAAAMVTSNH